MSETDPFESLRSLTEQDLAREGEDGLAHHLFERATYARLKYNGLAYENIETFLQDPECVRYPTRILYEYGEMAMHQFAQPELDYRNISGRSYILYLRPDLKNRPDLIPLAIAYMVPLINYGEIIKDDHCVKYGAALLGMDEDAYYAKVCEMAEIVKAEHRFTTG